MSSAMRGMLIRTAPNFGNSQRLFKRSHVEQSDLLFCANRSILRFCSGLPNSRSKRSFDQPLQGRIRAQVLAPVSDPTAPTTKKVQMSLNKYFNMQS